MMTYVISEKSQYICRNYSRQIFQIIRKMAIKYRVKTKPDNIGNRESPKYYAVPVRSGIVDLHHIAEDLADQSTLTISDVYATMVGVSSLIEHYLAQGYAVKIDGLGIFSLSVSSKGFDQPEECTATQVEARKICFRADKRLKMNLKLIKFVRDKETK